MKITVVIPTYNEAENITVLLPQLFSVLPAIQVLVVDDNSPDGTASAVQSLRNRFPHLELLSRTGERGFGSAYIAGFRRVLETDAEAVLMMDADLSHNPSYLPAMIMQLAACDVVIGSRYVPQGGVSGWELWRRILSRAGNAYIRTVTGMPFHDCTGGFNLIRTEFLHRLDWSGLHCAGYAFIMQLKYSLWKSGARVRESPIVFSNRTIGESKLSSGIVLEGLSAPWKVRAKAA